MHDGCHSAAFRLPVNIALSAGYVGASTFVSNRDSDAQHFPITDVQTVAQGDGCIGPKSLRNDFVVKCHCERPKGSEESAFVSRREEKQILRSSTPPTAKAAIAGDPGCAQDDTLGKDDTQALRQDDTQARDGTRGGFRNEAVGCRIRGRSCWPPGFRLLSSTPETVRRTTW
jgi:hypothetical protein